MLEQLKKSTGGILAKLLLGLLVLSFAVWGVADQLGGRQTTVLATVGDREISSQRYQVAYQNELQRISTQIGQRLSSEQARAFGLERRVLNRLLGSAAIDNHAGDLSLAISDEAIAASIRADPNLQGPDGKFSRSTFEQILNRIGMSEATFVATQRKEELRQQLTNAVAADAAVPAPLFAIMHRYQNETRVIKAVTLDAKISGKVPEPTDAALKAYFAENKNQFVTPSYRQVTLLTVTSKDAEKFVKLGDEELRKVYLQTKSDYDVAEKRSIQQIAFPDKAAAEIAYVQLSKARDFKAAAEKLGFKESDYDIGETTQSAMIDQTIAAAAFKLPLGKLSRPIEGTFSTVLLRVSKISQGKESTFKAVKEQVRAKLASERSRQELQKLLNNIDEERGTGKTLKEIVDALKLAHLNLAAIDDKGQSADGKPALTKTLPPADWQKITAAIFAGGVGVENEVVELGDGGYAWFDILGETPSKQRAFDAARADVKAILLDLDGRKAIAKVARDAVQQINDGLAIDKLARKLNLKVTTSKPLKRQARAKGLSQAVMRRAFTLKKGRAASAQSEDGASRTIITITEIKPAAAATDAEKKALRASLAQQIAGDHMNEYVTALMTRYGQSVNQAVFNRANGRELLDGSGNSGGGGLGGLF